MKKPLLILLGFLPFLLANGERTPDKVLTEIDVIKTVSESDLAKMQAQEADRDKSCSNRELWETIHAALDEK